MQPPSSRVRHHPSPCTILTWDMVASRLILSITYILATLNPAAGRIRRDGDGKLIYLGAWFGFEEQRLALNHNELEMWAPGFSQRGEFRRGWKLTSFFRFALSSYKFRIMSFLRSPPGQGSRAVLAEVLSWLSFLSKGLVRKLPKALPFSHIVKGQYVVLVMIICS